MERLRPLNVFTVRSCDDGTGSSRSRKMKEERCSKEPIKSIEDNICEIEKETEREHNLKYLPRADNFSTSLGK